MPLVFYLTGVICGLYYPKQPWAEMGKKVCRIIMWAILCYVDFIEKTAFTG